MTGLDGRVVVSSDGSNVRDGLRPALGAYGRLVAEGLSEPCSVTYLGRGLALTAGSCFLPIGGTSERVTPLHQDYSWRPGTALPAGYVAFDVGGSKAPTGFEVLELESTAERNYAVLRLSEIDQDLDARVAQALDFAAPPARTSSDAFGYGAPPPSYTAPVPGETTMLLTWASSCRSTFTPGASLFLHDCDTVAGMTGAAIVSDETGKVIGVHGGRAGTQNWGTAVSAIPSLRAYALGAKRPPRPEVERLAATTAGVNFTLDINPLYHGRPTTVDALIYRAAGGAPVITKTAIPLPHVGDVFTVNVDVSVPGTLDPGTYYVVIKAVDEFGLTGTSRSRNTVVR